MALEFGLKVIFPLFGDYSYLIALTAEQHERYLSTISKLYNRLTLFDKFRTICPGRLMKLAVIQHC